jgi:DNA mismatch endonuclease (patch repair protein)
MPKPLRPLKPTAEVSERMRRVATKGTAPELRVRAVARRLKIRHTTQTSRLPGRPDLVLPDHNVAVFVHGCFWHGCPRCYTEPKRNRRWWRQKIAGNQRRDRRKANELRILGYSVMTFMEHDTNQRIEKRLRTTISSRG